MDNSKKINIIIILIIMVRKSKPHKLLTNSVSLRISNIFNPHTSQRDFWPDACMQVRNHHICRL